MKNFFLLLFACFSGLVVSQVNCDLTLETTLETFNVYIHNPSGATMYRAKFYVDADGSPRAYGPNNSGLDYTANAGSPGNWWGVVTDASGNPILQGSGDPFPGMYVSTTSLVDANYGTNNPLRYTNSETVPFIAMPSSVRIAGGISVGDVCYVYNTTNGQSCFAIYADAGPAGAIGEGSMYLASALGINPNPRTGGTSQGIIDYVVFPNSGFGQGKIPSISEIDSMGTLYLNQATVGGACIASCIGPMFGQSAPLTNINSAPAWDTTSFNVVFNDQITGCINGFEEQFYHVSDYNSTEWRSNNANGFYNDDFIGSTFHSDWSFPSGSWAINASGIAEQSDEVSSNTNLYTALNQNTNNAFLYCFKASLNGSGTSRRAGFHFFADQPDSSNRGNSYFVWFRLDNDKIQIYKVINNSWGTSPVADIVYNFNAGQTYDFKTLYNKNTGVIRVYVNDINSAEWIDSSPIQTGDYISFRSANCNFKVDDIKTYKLRNNNATIYVGSSSLNDIRYQNPSPTQAAGKINSIVIDNAKAISVNVTQFRNIDFSTPNSFTINDGLGADEDITNNGTQLAANWANSIDVNSNINSYYYSVGTSPGASNIVGWTNNGTNTSVNITGLSLNHLQYYYLNVEAVNGAMLRSSIYNSDGIQYIDQSVGIRSNTNSNENVVSIFPNPASYEFTIKSKSENYCLLYDALGKLQQTVFLNKNNDFTCVISGLPSGMYFLVSETTTGLRKKIIIQ